MKVVKPSDESVSSASTGTTLQDDNHLSLTGVANTLYAVRLCALVIEGSSTVTDIKMAWTQPSGCTLNLAGVAPHIDYNASAAALETEWAAWQNETGTTTSTKQFGTSTTVFSYVFSGTWEVGSTGGPLQLQWAQRVANAANLTMKQGSSLVLTPLP